jgi:ABC-type multidrug transport system ATPase subunit
LIPQFLTVDIVAVAGVKGLDPKSRQELWRVINELKKTSSIILTTHSMEEADRVADRVMIMAEGKVKCIGVSADLKNS